MSSAGFHAEVRALRRERVLDASVELITERGWDGLSMTAVAERSGVPRQGLYKEVGDRTALGRAVVARELERFLTWVREGLAAHPESVEGGIAAAVRAVLVHGRENPLIASILRPGDDSGLLALVAVDPEAVLGQATAVIGAVLGDAASEALVDSVVRLTVSHVLQPTVDVDEAVDRIRRVVRGFR